MPPCNCHHPFPRPEPFSPLPRPGKVPDWGKWIRDRLAEKGALLVFPGTGAFPDPGAGPNLYLAEDTDIVYRWDGAHYQVVFDPELANDVLEYEDRGHFPETGHHGKLYIAADTGSLYRWDDTGYADLLPGKADKAVPAAGGNLAALTQAGNLVDSGKKPADFATAEQGAKADTAVQPEDLPDKLPNPKALKFLAGSSGTAFTSYDGSEEKEIGRATNNNFGLCRLTDVLNSTSGASTGLGASAKTVKTVNDKVVSIEGKIPSQASASNQLADKDFVNSSIATETATFRGTFNLITDLELPLNATHEQVAAAVKTALGQTDYDGNDYVFVQIPQDLEHTDAMKQVDRYKCVETGTDPVVKNWAYEWTLNNSSFTAAQWAAINSGITSGKIAELRDKLDLAVYDFLPETWEVSNTLYSGGTYTWDDASTQWLGVSGQRAIRAKAGAPNTYQFVIDPGRPGEVTVCEWEGTAEQAVPFEYGGESYVVTVAGHGNTGLKPTGDALARKSELPSIPLQTADIADGAVVNAKLGNESVSGAKIRDKAVTRGKIADSAVDSTPTAGSNNLVTSGGVESALAGKKNDFDAGNGLVETSNTLYAYKGIAGTTTEGETRYTVGPADVGSTVYSWNGSSAAPTGETVTMINTTIGRIYTASFPNPVYYDRSATDDITRPGVISIDETVVAKKNDVPAPSTSTPSADSGSGSVGSSAAYARGDHVHPTDTSRMAATATGADIPVSGTDATTIDAALTGKATMADATLNISAGPWTCSPSTIEVETETGVVTESVTIVPQYSGTVLTGWRPATDGTPNGETKGDAFSSDLVWEADTGWIGHVNLTATREVSNGMVLGSQTDKPVASEAEAEALRTGKVDKSGGTMTGGLTVPNLTVGTRKSGSVVGTYSVAEGNNITARGTYSHAEGNDTAAIGGNAHAEGRGTSAVNDFEHAQGRYNSSHKQDGNFGSPGNTLSSIGFGTADNARKNAVETMQDGKTFIYGLGGYDGTNPTGSGVKDIVAAIDDKASKSDVDSLLFARYYPEGNVKSAAEFTAGIKYDAPDTTNRTITVKPFCDTDDSDNDNSNLSGRVVIPLFVDAQGNGYISDDGTRFKVVGVSGGVSNLNNQNLTSIVAPTTVTTIGADAFASCTSLSSVSLPAATAIGVDAFGACTSLTSVSFPAATTISDYAFAFCTSLSSVSLPAATAIGVDAFGACTSLTSVSFPAATSIGAEAFDSCTSLASVSLPAATAVGNYAFASCTSLASVSLPAATAIGYGTFASCTSLASVDFGDTPRSSVPALGADAFFSVPTTCKIIVPDAQYDAWTAQTIPDPEHEGETIANPWYALVTAGYRFLRHSGWEYARKYELDGKANRAANPTAGNLAALDAQGNPTDSLIPKASVVTIPTYNGQNRGYFTSENGGELSSWLAVSGSTESTLAHGPWTMPRSGIVYVQLQQVSNTDTSVRIGVNGRPVKIENGSVVVDYDYQVVECRVAAKSDVVYPLFLNAGDKLYMRVYGQALSKMTLSAVFYP